VNDYKRNNLYKYGAIFDLDGTILYTLEDLAFSLNRALKALNFPEHTVSEYRDMVGNGITQLTVEALPEGFRDDAHVLKMRERFMAEYHEHQTDLTKPYPGIKELLASLKELGLPLGVLSNKDHQNTVEVVEHFFPGVFKAVFGASNDRPIKPDPGGALMLAKILERNPSHIFYFGDSDVDMYTATNAGFIPIGVSWGFRSKEIVKDAGACVVIDRPEDFFEALSGLSLGELDE
jgi:phosphoglycolate phosphatase